MLQSREQPGFADRGDDKQRHHTDRRYRLRQPDDWQHDRLATLNPGTTIDVRSTAGAVNLDTAASGRS